MTEQASREAYLPYAPAPGAEPRPLAAILNDLERPIHASFLQTKRKGGADITFISWHTATRILDRYAPGWQYDTHSHLSADGAHVVVDARIGIFTSDYGWIWRGATGSDEEEDRAYGDASDRAESQALRRCCAKFRLGLYLYYEKGANGPTQQGKHAQTASQKESGVQSPVAAPPKPLEAVTAPHRGNQGPTATAQQGARVTSDQLAVLRGLVAAVGMGDDDKIAYLHKYHATQFGQLTEAEAAACITHLQKEADRIQPAVAS